jgi:hypothetical protein
MEKVENLYRTARAQNDSIGAPERTNRIRPVRRARADAEIRLVLFRTS